MIAFNQLSRTLVIAVLLLSTFPVFAMSSYDERSGHLNIPLIKAFDKVYRDVVVRFSAVLQVNGGLNYDGIESYHPESNTIMLGSVKAFGTVYTNVVVSLKDVVSVGSVCSGSDACQGLAFSVNGNDVSCVKNSKIEDLNYIPIKKFEGLWSNWKNGSSIPGFDATQKFTLAISNLAAVAKDTNDENLKHEVSNALYRMAVNGAFTDTRMCITSDGFMDGTCTQWIDPNGNDVSAGQTANFVRINVESMRVSYSLISDWVRLKNPSKHVKIKEWFNFWSKQMYPLDRVYFGVGTAGYQWKIQDLLDSGRAEDARVVALKLIDGLLPLINDDGSIVERTSRGNRALWYHFTSLNEIIVNINLAKRLGIQVPVELERKLHFAVDLFLRAIVDPDYISKWASAGHNNGGDGRSQEFWNGRPNDFTGWFNSIIAGSWMFLYNNWYPNHNNSASIRKIVPMSTARSQFTDTDYVALGCLLY